MAPPRKSPMGESTNTWDSWGEKEPHKGRLATLPQDENNKPVSTPYQSRLPELDMMLNLKTAKYARKIRRGNFYKAIFDAATSESRDQKTDDWLRDAEMKLWGTYSDGPFPGTTTQAVPEEYFAWKFSEYETSKIDPVSDRVSDSLIPSPRNYARDSDGIVNHHRTRSDSDGMHPVRAPVRDSFIASSNKYAYDNDDYAYLSSSDSDSGGAQIRYTWADLDNRVSPRIEMSSYDTFDNYCASDTPSKVDSKEPSQITTSKWEFPGGWDFPRSSGEALEYNVVAEGDMEEEDYTQLSTAINNALTNAVESHDFHTVKVEPKSNVKSSGEGFVVPTGATKTRKSQKHSSSTRYADMATPSAPRTKGTKSCGDVTRAGARGIQRPASGIDGTKKAAALSAWAAFPARAAKEDKADATAYKNQVTGESTNIAPIIKETYTKVAILGERFERKIVDKSVNIIQ